MRHSAGGAVEGIRDMILHRSRSATGHVGLVGSARTGRLSGVSKSGLPGFGKKLCDNKGL